MEDSIEHRDITNNPTMPEHQNYTLSDERCKNKSIVLTEQQQLNVRKKLETLRQQFYTEFLTEKKPKGSQLKRSMTERMIRGRSSRDCFVDSGLSSPGSNLSTDDSDLLTYADLQRTNSTRYISPDKVELKQSLYKSVNDLQHEAQYLATRVNELSSTTTMRRRRTETSNLSISARRQLSMEKLGSYIPTAPGESVWGQRFDELMARLRGCELSHGDREKAPEKTIQPCRAAVVEEKIQSECASVEHRIPVQTFRDYNTPTETHFEEYQSPVHSFPHKSSSPSLSPPDRASQYDLDTVEDSSASQIKGSNRISTHSIDNTANTSTHLEYRAAIQCGADDSGISDSSLGTQSPVHSHSAESTAVDEGMAEEVEQTYSVVQHTICEPIESVETTPPIIQAKMSRSVTEELRRPPKSDLKSMLRSLSFHRPDIATYNMPLGSIRRTDSNNDVWVERPAQKPKYQQSAPSLTNKTQNKQSSTWKRLSRVFSFRSSSKTNVNSTTSKKSK